MGQGLTSLNYGQYIGIISNKVAEHKTYKPDMIETPPANHQAILREVYDDTRRSTCHGCVTTHSICCVGTHGQCWTSMGHSKYTGIMFLQAIFHSISVWLYLVEPTKPRAILCMVYFVTLRTTYHGYIASHFTCHVGAYSIYEKTGA